MLVIAPCSDAATCETETTQQTSHGHDHSEDSEDNCTPFCTCQCCGALVIVASIVKYDDLKEAPSFSFSFNYSFNYAFDYTKGIWHPPVIS